LSNKRGITLKRLQLWNAVDTYIRFQTWSRTG